MKDNQANGVLSKRRHVLAVLNFGLVVVILGFLAYILFAPITPAKLEVPIVNTSSNIVAGETIMYELKSCRYVDESVVTTVTRKLVSTTDASLAPILLSQDVVSNPKKCVDNMRTLIVPLATPAGNYRLVVTAVYQVIPLRAPISISTTSAPFDVKPSTTNLDIQSLLDENAELQQKIDSMQ